MSVTEISFNEINSPSAISAIMNVIGPRKIVAIIGSRTLSNDSEVKTFAWNIGYQLCHEKKCKVVSGGAFGPDQAGMEGAINARLGSLSPAIPLSSRNLAKFSALVLSLTGEVPVVNVAEGKVTIGRLIAFYPDFSLGYHVGKYYERDEKIANISEVVAALWDGSSTGTKKTIDAAEKLGKKVLIVKVKRA